MAIANMQELFIDELGDLYDAEHRFLELQRELAPKAKDQKLKNTLHEDIEQTQQHIKNLEKVFDRLGQQTERKTCPVADGLVRETQNNVLDAESESIQDGIINAGLAKIEHYEMAGYQTLISGAQLMKQSEIVDMLEQNLKQEEDAARDAELNTRELFQKILDAERE